MLDAVQRRGCPESLTSDRSCEQGAKILSFTYRANRRQA